MQTFYNPTNLLEVEKTHIDFVINFEEESCVSFISLWLATPNKEELSISGAHTLYHILNQRMRYHFCDDSSQIIEIYLKACLAGFDLICDGDPAAKK
jgi:S-ribosylhomocysteine lyase LuxS involved in autoinducer biosynthesis